MKSLTDRAEAVFRQARQQIGEDCARLHAENAAKGALGSGATARQAVRIFGSRSSEALQQVLGEVAQRIEHRGMRQERYPFVVIYKYRPPESASL